MLGRRNLRLERCPAQLLETIGSGLLPCPVFPGGVRSREGVQRGSRGLRCGAVEQAREGEAAVGGVGGAQVAASADRVLGVGGTAGLDQTFRLRGCELLLLGQGVARFSLGCALPLWRSAADPAASDGVATTSTTVTVVRRAPG